MKYSVQTEATDIRNIFNKKTGFRRAGFLFPGSAQTNLVIGFDIFSGNRRTGPVSFKIA